MLSSPNFISMALPPGTVCSCRTRLLASLILAPSPQLFDSHSPLGRNPTSSSRSRANILPSVSLFQSSSPSRTDFSPLRFHNSDATLLGAAWYQLYEPASWTETLSPNYALQHTLKWTNIVKLFELVDLSKSHLHFSTIWYNMIQVITKCKVKN